MICLAALALGACSTAPTTKPVVKGVGGSVVDLVSETATSIVGGPIIPNTSLVVGPSVTYPLEKLVYWGVWVGAAYLILDPLSPNWQIEEARFPENHVHFQLAMKRFYAGGAGEARVIFHRRAKELMRAGGFGSYEVVEYSEGMDSSVLGSKRVAEGVVRFKKTVG
ncbi:hypothetical protein MASR1M60_21900 [Rhodocyclaceae bacterium]